MDICKIRRGFDNALIFESAETNIFDLNELIKNDEKYGKISAPNNIITYAILNGDDEMPANKFAKAVELALMSWYFEIPVYFKRVTFDEEPRLSFEFQREEDDPNLDHNTIAYAYFPTAGSWSGICVMNKSFYFTHHGKPLPMWEIDPEHYTEGSTTATGKTMDVDMILRHEVGHILGLPHDIAPYNTMSPNESIMAEHHSERDKARIHAKYGKRSWYQWLYKALINRYRDWSE